MKVFAIFGIAASGGAALSNLTTFTVNGTPHVDNDVISLPNGTTSVTIAATDGGSIEDLVGDTGLVDGDNACTFTVRAQDGVTTAAMSLTLHVINAGFAETFTIDFTGLSGADFVTAGDGKYLTYVDAGAETRTPWFDTGTENVPTGAPNPELITITPSSSASDIATAAAGGIWSSYTPSVVGNVLTLTANAIGPRTDAADGNTGAVVTITQQGANPS